MQTMNISLPDQLKEFVDKHADSGRYPDDQKRTAQEKLEGLIMEGIQVASRPK